MVSITPCLWFDDDLEDALGFYRSVFPDMVVHEETRRPDGGLFLATFQLAGQRLQGLNGGPYFHFTEAVSLVLSCDGQDEVDRYWDALLTGGGEESQCGWLKDRFGLSWQVVPVQFVEMMRDPDPEKVGRMTAAMQPMRKLDIATLRTAFDG